MTKTRALSGAPLPNSGDKEASTVGISSPSQLFINLALDMSWRLAIVVLLPILVGFEIDKQAKTTPLLTIVGLILAIGGVVIVMKRTLKQVNLNTPKLKDKVNNG